MGRTREELAGHHREMVEQMGGFEHFIKRVGVKGFVELRRSGGYVAPLTSEEYGFLVRRYFEEVRENGKKA